ncbi:LuxR C-terminal-related transcriptional regulator [Arthrobacter sp. AZCC_0090]|uniref:LuxR C-terminal-related transcriptional regulator n=1 Tax=Arthrobacter sp. AZCC_0090 TaxID=2735881 RepID=UPI001612BFEC|nr:LuxR C-terminal-related transcriptional regulator [Arthrobacter sp. AZCC_0090]MBB6403581.1 DNA-binding CsgD family transcriptional regulator [Arthrobacter sp. AZCC_0090]
MDDTEGTQTSPPIIRAAELQEIVIALSGPEPAGIVISGPSGSGMTTLLDAAASVLRGSFSVIAHNVSESFADIPFGIAMALVPELPARSKVWPGSIVAACRKAVRAASAAGSPALLVLDNIDFLDDMSLWLLSQLLVEPDIRMIATHRSDRPLRMELMESVVSRQLSVVTLDDLTPEQLREFLDDRLGGHAARSLVRDIHALTGGNLQTAKLLLDEAAARGEIVEQADSWMLSGPIRLDGSQALELTRHRLEGYSVPQRQVVDLLAAGEPIPMAILEQLVQKRAIEALRGDGTIRVQKDTRETASLSHGIEGRLARQQLGPARILALRRSIYEISAPAADDSLWTLFRRVDFEQESGLPVPDADLLAVAIAANDIHDNRRARRSADAVRAPELGLVAGLELARALYQTRDFPGAVTVLKGLVANTPDVLTMDFAQAVWLLLHALLPTSPGAKVLQAVLQDARRRLEAAAAAVQPDEPAYLDQAAVRDELDVLQLYLDAQNGSWPSASGELFQRLCRSQLLDPGLRSEHQPPPPTQAAVLLMALVSQGLAVSGRFSDAVALSTSALESLGRLPRCPVDFLSAVLTIHGSNLIWRGQWGGAEMFCAGSSSYSNRMSYFGGAAHLYRALVFARQGSLELACEQFRQAKARLDEADPDGLLPPALGGLAAAAWLLGDVNQVRRALAAYDSRRSSGNYLASQLAESYSSAARSVLVGAEHSHRKLLQLAGSAAKKGHRALEMLNLGLAARTGSRGYRQVGPGVSEVVWSVESGVPSGQEAGQEMGQRPGLGTQEAITGEPQQDRASDHEEVFAYDEPDAEGPEAGSSILPGVVKLSQREREVTALVASGLSSAEVAARLGIAVNTVNAHLQRVYGKLGVSRRQKLSELWDELAKPEE